MTPSTPSPSDSHRPSSAEESTTLVNLRAEAPLDAQALVDELFQALSPRFHGLRKLGQGGMGTVYVARDPLLKRDVAIKVLAPAYGADGAAHERFLREAQAAAAVAHPNVVSIFQVGELPATRVPYFIMQYIEGQTLEQAFPSGSPVAEPVARRIISEIAAALGAAHARGLVHRDIKPSNVMIDPHTGRAIVLDFGISASVRPQAFDEKLTAPGVYVGTPRYMSPEQSSGEGVTDKSDMYSLGCVAYELLTGHPVFEQKNMLALFAAHLRDTPRSLTELRPGLDRELGALVMRCLEKDPDKRPTAGEMSQRLTPGGSVLLEWPPPGLESMHGKLSAVTRLLWVGTALLLAPGLTLILAGAALPSVADSVAVALLLSLGGVAVGVLYVAARRAMTLGRAATATVRHGYAWLTVAETIVDTDGETGDLITGARRFAMLLSEQRSALRRGRLVRATAMALGGFTPIPALVLLLIAAAWLPFDHRFVLVVLLLPAIAALIAVREAARERMLAPAPQKGDRSPEFLDTSRLAPAWYESFGRARVGQALGPGFRQHTRIGIGGGLVVAATAALVVAIVVPLALVATLGSLVFSRALPKFTNTNERVLLAEVARPFVVPKDPRISPLDAGRAFYAIGQRRALAGSIRSQPLLPRPKPPWKGHPPAPTLFATARPDTSRWAGPSTQGILEAARRGFSAGELAYLRMVATAPVWRDWGIMARASAGDILGASVVIPFSANATWFDVPIPPFRTIKEVAYASLSRAAYHLALQQTDSAETALRETISVGFLLADNANTLIEQLIGLVIVGIGREGLTRLYAITGNAAGPGLKSKWDAAAAARDARSESDAVNPVDKAAPNRDAPAERRRAISLATQLSAQRGLRLEMLGMLGFASCTNVRELVFGPDLEIRRVFDQARRELARYPSDSALIDLMAGSAEHWAQRTELDLIPHVMVGTASIVGTILHNRRLRGCAEQLASGWW